MGGRVGPWVRSGRVRIFVGNRGSNRVGSTFRWVGSGPRKVTRGQLWVGIRGEEKEKKMELEYRNWVEGEGLRTREDIYVSY